MHFNLTLNDLVDLLTVGISISFGVYFICTKSIHPSRCFALFLLATSLTMISMVLGRIGFFSNNPSLLFLPISFSYAALPFLYLFLKAFASERKMSKDWKHLLPGATEFLLFAVFFILPNAMKVPLKGSVFWQYYYILSIPYQLVYLVLIVRFIDAYHHQLQANSTNIASRSLSRIRQFSLAFALLLLFALALLFLVDGNELPINNLIFSIGFYLVHFWVVAWGAQQQPLRETLVLLTNKEEKTQITKKEPVANPAALEENDFQLVKEFMESEKPYLDPELSLASLAQLLGMPQRYLSQLIKAHTNQNFNRFINTYRIKSACEKLADPAFDHLSIIGVAYDAGFNSKSSFYATFQEIVGVSPAEYKERRGK